jgi:hypothetical protein
VANAGIEPAIVGLVGRCSTLEHLCVCAPVGERPKGERLESNQLCVCAQKSGPWKDRVGER